MSSRPLWSSWYLICQKLSSMTLFRGFRLRVSTNSDIVEDDSMVKFHFLWSTFFSAYSCSLASLIWTMEDEMKSLGNMDKECARWWIYEMSNHTKWTFRNKNRTAATMTKQQSYPTQPWPIIHVQVSRPYFETDDYYRQEKPVSVFRISDQQQNTLVIPHTGICCMDMVEPKCWPGGGDHSYQKRSAKKPSPTDILNDTFTQQIRWTKVMVLSFWKIPTVPRNDVCL